MPATHGAPKRTSHLYEALGFNPSVQGKYEKAGVTLTWWRKLVLSARIGGCFQLEKKMCPPISFSPLPLLPRLVKEH